MKPATLPDAHSALQDIATADITGLVLAGGRGRRMGGVDKGLQPFGGQPLVAHALRRLRPQVGQVLISANRHAEAYAAFGVPVLADGWPDFPGPLAGLLTGLRHCATPWLAAVPCDAPFFPADLVPRLATAARQHAADVALAATRAPDGHLQMQPVFCLLAARLADAVEPFLRGGQRSLRGWAATQRCAVVEFTDALAFQNANTAADLLALGAAVNGQNQPHWPT